ncbi:MAG: hypothetical protein AB7G15_10260 [Alphaproteobacteria bacterium]
MTSPVRDIYLVGTIPMTRPYDVFTLVADTVGDRIARVPDGEIGDRRQWILGQYALLATAKGMEVSDYPKEGMVRHFGYNIPVRPKAGATVDDIDFGELGYARYAIAHYALFRALKEIGRIPKHWRFQVNLPMPMDVMLMVEPAARAVVERAYERSMVADLRRIQDAIPHDELAITWDEVHGVLVWEDPNNQYVRFWFPDKQGGALDRYVRFGNMVAPGVELGFHLCYGSQNNKHAMEPKDLSACVNLTNAVTERLARKLDYVQMPVPHDRRDDAYYAPLANLRRERVGQVYLGLVHYEDGVPGIKQRIATAERFLPNFGISTECGFGRMPSDHDIRRLLEMHRQAV